MTYLPGNYLARIFDVAKAQAGDERDDQLSFTTTIKEYQAFFDAETELRSWLPADNRSPEAKALDEAEADELEPFAHARDEEISPFQRAANKAYDEAERVYDEAVEPIDRKYTALMAPIRAKYAALRAKLPK